MPEHALDNFIGATKMVRVIPLNAKKRSNFKEAQKLCIFRYNVMKTIGVRQGMSIMHLGVMDTFFHICEALDSMPQN